MSYINRLQFHPRLQDWADLHSRSARPASGFYRGVNNLVRYLHNSGMWDRIVCMGILCANTVGNCLIDLKNPNNRFTPGGTLGPLARYRGLGGDGTTFFLDTGINLQTNPAGFTAHDIMFGTFSPEDHFPVFGGHGATGGGTTVSILSQRNINWCQVAAASKAGVVKMGVTATVGLRAVARTQDDVVRYYQDNTAENLINVVAPAGLPGQMYMFRIGKAKSFTTETVSLFWIGHSQGVTDQMVAGLYNNWVATQYSFGTLDQDGPGPIPITKYPPPHAFRQVSHQFIDPPDQFICTPGLPPSTDVSDAASTFAQYPIDATISRPSAGGFHATTVTNVKLIEQQWGWRNIFPPGVPPVGKANDFVGTYTTPGQLVNTVTLTPGHGYQGFNNVFTQVMPNGFTCTFTIGNWNEPAENPDDPPIVHINGILSATVTAPGTYYPAFGSLTITDAGGGTGARVSFKADTNVSGTGGVVSLSVDYGGDNYVTPVGTIVTPTGTNYEIVGQVDNNGGIPSLLIFDRGKNFPPTGWYTFADPAGIGTGARGIFTAAPQSYQCWIENNNYDSAEICTDLRLAFTLGYKWHRDTDDEDARGIRYYMTRVRRTAEEIAETPGNNSIYHFDPEPWDALWDLHCFDKAQALTDTRYSTRVVDTEIEGPMSVGHTLLVDLEVTDTFTGPAGARLVLHLETSPVADFSSGMVEVASSPEIPIASLVEGWQMPTWRAWGNYGSSPGFACTVTQVGGVINDAFFGAGQGGGIGGLLPNWSGLLRISDPNMDAGGAVVRFITDSSGIPIRLSVWPGKGGSGYTAPTATIDFACHRYLRMRYEVLGGPFTAGRFTVHTPINEFRSLGPGSASPVWKDTVAHPAKNLGRFSPRGYWKRVASPELFPHTGISLPVKTAYNLGSTYDYQLRDVENSPCWGILFDFEMNDRKPPNRFKAQCQRLGRIAHSKTCPMTGEMYKVFLGMDPIVGGGGQYVGMDVSNANEIATNYVDLVNIVCHLKPPNGDILTYINNQVDVYRGPDGNLPLPVEHMLFQFGVGNPPWPLEFCKASKIRMDELGIKNVEMHSGFAIFGGPSSRPENQVIIEFFKMAPGGIFA